VAGSIRRKRESRLIGYEPDWWGRSERFADSYSLSEAAREALFDLIYQAICESGARFVGANGGAKGGAARAAALSPARRSEIASMAARARWGVRSGAGDGHDGDLGTDQTAKQP
jgi:hypothetical protein